MKRQGPIDHTKIYLHTSQNNIAVLMNSIVTEENNDDAIAKNN